MTVLKILSFIFLCSFMVNTLWCIYYTYLSIRLRKYSVVGDVCSIYFGEVKVYCFILDRFGDNITIEYMDDFGLQRSSINVENLYP